MTLSDKQKIFTKNVASLIQHINDSDYGCTLGEAYRTEEQAAIYAKEGKGIKDSLHCRRLAVDLNLFSKDGVYITDSKPYEIFGKYWTLLHPHNRWGGTFPKPDGNHFEMQDI